VFSCLCLCFLLLVVVAARCGLCGLVVACACGAVLFLLLRFLSGVLGLCFFLLVLARLLVACLGLVLVLRSLLFACLVVGFLLLVCLLVVCWLLLVLVGLLRCLVVSSDVPLRLPLLVRGSPWWSCCLPLPWAWCLSLGCSSVPLGFVMSFASFVSALPVVGAVSSAVAPRPVSLLASVPRARWSAPVSVVAVVRSGEDEVSVSCSDGRVRFCRPSYASRALGRPVSVDAVFSRLSARVGSSVRFCAAFGYSPDSWFVGVEAV